MSGFDNDDDAVKLFRIDIQELSKELKCFGEELSMTTEEWQSEHGVDRSMDDCQGTLARIEQALEQATEGAKKVETAGMPLDWRTLDFDSKEASLLHREFTSYRRMIQLSRLLIAYVS